MKWRDTTKGGLPVRIYAEDGHPNRPIHGAVRHEGEWHPYTWSKDGHYGMEQFDLVPATPIIDWSKQPDWVKAVAMDEDGGWNRFEHIPNRSGKMWLRQKNGGFMQNMHPSEYPAFDGDWKDSLCVRPEGGAE